MLNVQMKVVDECSLGTHTCDPNADCVDTPEGYTCRCKTGWKDSSRDPLRSPGRVCRKERDGLYAFSRARLRRHASRLLSGRDEVISEGAKVYHSGEDVTTTVCVFVHGTYKCRCASGYSRLPDGRCLAINECEHQRLNTCGQNAECIDLAEGYTCQCRSGFADVSPAGQPGRLCKARINECSNKEKYRVDCDENAICVDTDDSFTCQCRPGFADISAAFNRLPGRRCIEAINECSIKGLNDCSEFALCEDAKEGYVCSCRNGYVDASPNATHYPGRVCRKPIERLTVTEFTSSFSHDSCDPKKPRCGTNEICTDRGQRGHHSCQCADNAFRYEDGTCRVYSACSRNTDCDPNAVCLNVFDSYSCQCRPGYIDMSPDPERRPGRRCKELVNECATTNNECSPYAKCIDLTEGYACQCLEGYVDISSKHKLPPGRRCSQSSEHFVTTTRTVLILRMATPASQVKCPVLQCFAGFIDVSSNANLPPGRVCTVQTTCPKQKTDLVFLIDGSGSIGSYVFKNEVLRFVREFVELFEIGLDQTRVALIQYSDQIRHEFDLDQYTDKAAVLRAITETQYLTGLTRTGAAIQHMVQEGFSERRGARPQAPDIASVRSFSPTADLDTRLRSMIQKAACPTPVKTESPPQGTCNPRTQTGCDRSLNEYCAEENGRTHCICPAGFHRHPTTRVCGGSLCNPQLITSCVYPEECLITPYNNYRCACPDGYSRDYRTGFCVSVKEVHVFPQHDADCHNGGQRCGQNEYCASDRTGHWYCECKTGFERSHADGKCSYPGSCLPNVPNSCDIRKKEKCLPHGSFYTCQCDSKQRRHPVTGICLTNECELGTHDCDRSARCIDTDDGFLCACPAGFIDRSPDTISRPGRLCVAEQNECLDGSN
ncbi:EGF-like domain protein, partial [Ostertagia ostertagi]